MLVRDPRVREHLGDKASPHTTTYPTKGQIQPKEERTEGSGGGCADGGREGGFEARQKGRIAALGEAIMAVAFEGGGVVVWWSMVK